MKVNGTKAAGELGAFQESPAVGKPHPPGQEFVKRLKSALEKKGFALEAVSHLQRPHAASGEKFLSDDLTAVLTADEIHFISSLLKLDEQTRSALYVEASKEEKPAPVGRKLDVSA